MSLVARTPALHRQILRSRAFVPSRGMHGEYKVCVCTHFRRKTVAIPRHSRSRSSLAHAVQL